MRCRVLLICVIFFNLSGYAGDCNDSLSLVGNYFSSYKFSHECTEPKNISGVFVINHDFKNILRSKRQSEKEINKAIAFSTTGTIMACVGGAVWGWSLSDLTFGKEVNKNLLIATIPIIGIGLTFDVIGTKHMKQSVRLYNQQKD